MLPRVAAAGENRRFHSRKRVLGDCAETGRLDILVGEFRTIDMIVGWCATPPQVRRVSLAQTRRHFWSEIPKTYLVVGK
jgi:hypothetical protein